MCLLHWLRSKLEPQPRAPRVVYGLGPPPKPTPDGLCPLCGGEVADIKLKCSFSTYDGLGGVVLRGRCSACDTALLRGGLDFTPEWRVNAPDAARLLGQVEEVEFARLTEMFGGHRTFGTEWHAFLAHRRQGDEVWQFGGADGPLGYAVVRQGRPLAQFLDPGQELMEALA